MAISATLTVNTGGQPYPVYIANGMLSRAGEALTDILPSKKICVVTDETVAKTHLFLLMRALEVSGFQASPPIILPAGESSKNFQNLQMIVDRCLSYKLDRKSTLIALGGGVIGDITGFAASMIMRGINFVQVPTTLLAQVDSSVGGKTAINTAQGKNLVGAFYQPRAVLIDTETLKSLPIRELKAGYAEVLKYALIGRPDFFEWLEQNLEKVMSYDAEALQYIIEVSCREKAAVVAADEREEKDIRALLNLGHTFGHALEAMAGYNGTLLHGEAVAIGMALAFDFSTVMGHCPAADAKKVAAHLGRAGLLSAAPFRVDPRVMLDKMRSDKKKSGDLMTLILARGIGKAFVDKNVAESEVLAFLENIFV